MNSTTSEGINKIIAIIWTVVFSFAKKVAIAMDKVISCERIGVAVIGLEVPHAHVHLIPIDSVSDMDFKQPKLSLKKEEMKKIADLINGIN